MYTRPKCYVWMCNHWPSGLFNMQTWNVAKWLYFIPYFKPFLLISHRITFKFSLAFPSSFSYNPFEATKPSLAFSIVAFTRRISFFDIPLIGLLHRDTPWKSHMLDSLLELPGCKLSVYCSCSDQAIRGNHSTLNKHRGWYCSCSVASGYNIMF